MSLWYFVLCFVSMILFAAIPAILKCTETGLPSQTACPYQSGIMRYCLVYIIIIASLYACVHVIIILFSEHALYMR